MRATRGLIALLAAAVLLLPAIAPPPASAASFNVNGPIAFERGTGYETEIWLMAPDGTGQAAIPGLAWTGFRDPALSPDSSKLALAPYGSGAVSVVNIDGSDWHELAGGFVWDPAWSRDGTRIAFASNEAADWYGLATVLADGTDPAAVFWGPGENPSSPVWSPDGTTITLGGHDDLTGASFVERVNADGTNRMRLVTLPPGEWVSGVTLSPDGAQIAYGLRYANEIWTVTADGYGPHKLADGVEPAWSPDGTKIAYTCGDQICVMNADGTGSVQLTTEGVNRDPFWGRAQTPDGTLLAWGNNPPPYGLTGVVAIDVANPNGVALKSDGTVVAWSTDPCGYGLQPPPGLNNVIAVSAAGTYSLALKSDGTVVAWGGWPCGQFDPGGGTVSVPAGLTGVKAIAAGEAIALALKTDGTVVAWNWGGLVDLSPAFDSGVAAIAAGALSASALKTDGTVRVWDLFGGDYALDVTNAAAIAVGDGWDGGGGGQLLALKADGTVVGQGDDTWGKAIPPAGLTGVTAIAAGSTHSLALKSDGTVVGWGLNDIDVISGPASIHGVTAIVAGGQESIVFIGTGYVYPFAGFVAPVDNDKLNVAKAGSAIPVKFSLGGDKGLDIFADGYPRAVRISCDTGEPADTVEEYVVASMSGLTYDATTDRYQYTWKTQKSVTGCFQLRLGLTDGSVHTADFKLK